MSSDASLKLLATWMAGHFRNRSQALRDPVWFAHIHVYQCPLPWQVFGGWGFYVEQAYDIMLDRPYRQRLLQLIPGDPIRIQNYELLEPERWLGSGRDRCRLLDLQPEDCRPLAGCQTLVHWTGDAFVGRCLPGKTCRVIRKGQETYLHSEFRIQEGLFFSLDQGRDPQTDQVVWGSLSGPFEFEKVESFPLGELGKAGDQGVHGGGIGEQGDGPHFIGDFF
ncbi:MAG: chromophore lyase CpcT/CpeT [Thermostichales cyanobacterium BF4_bins_65]